jgi:hypothetical protein
MISQTAKEKPLRSQLSANFLKNAVYLDSPVLTALNQIMPFYETGIFSKKETPLLLRTKPIIKLQLMATSLPKDINVCKLSSGGYFNGAINTFKDLERLSPSGVVFYPFNSQSNMNAITNRKALHVLTLHGESNKLASSRPAARMYDYICVAGPLAIQRYLDSSIFTPADVEQGRLIMMGDSFVQDMPWIRPAVIDEPGALLYCPTWEGYGNGPVNYSSVHNKKGFAVLSEAARNCGAKKIIIKPHPYLGLIKRHLLLDFVAGVGQLVAQGENVELALSDSSLPLKALCLLKLPHVARAKETASNPEAISLGLCDVSGMEAIFLKQQIANLVIGPSGDVPPLTRDIYRQKTLLPDAKSAETMQNYLKNFNDIDNEHRALIFGYQDPKLTEMTPNARRNWLVDFVCSDPFWHSRTTIPKKELIS